ncbi:MAG TPA: TIGR03364 family FAD-dependent oxidoreductase [Chitinophagaceae bacterium]|nr:TIGR03364 family FAD-dependent oxidoreductase [Chitinophagaceae bacterium]
MLNKSAIVIGAGIVGLSTARALAVRGYKVKVIDREQKAVGASVRNFGMVWPIGQPAGDAYETAMLSRRLWKELADKAGIWYEEAGSLHLAYEKDEWKVLGELKEIYKNRDYHLLDAVDVLKKSPAVVPGKLIGGLYSKEELIVDPRQAMERIPLWLAEKFGVEFLWGKAVTAINYPSVVAGAASWQADEIYLCSGADFETLYPELYAGQPLTKCKLQMMRMEPQRNNWRIGPALCAGLSLLHYTAFQTAPSINILKKRIQAQCPDYIKWGIHVMVSQNQSGELTIGDSHEYGLTHEPFDKAFINDMILDYLQRFARFNNNLITETWNGVYPKLTNGQTHLIVEPGQGVTIINGLGGAGMTMSLGLCERWMQGRS